MIIVARVFLIIAFLFYVVIPFFDLGAILGLPSMEVSEGKRIVAYPFMFLLLTVVLAFAMILGNVHPNYWETGIARQMQVTGMLGLGLAILLLGAISSMTTSWMNWVTFGVATAICAAWHLENLHLAEPRKTGNR